MKHIVGLESCMKKVLNTDRSNLKLAPALNNWLYETIYQNIKNGIAI